MEKVEKIRTKDIEPDENVSFSDLMLSQQVLDGLKNAGFFKPSPIQLKAIPLGKLGLDLIVQAKSGTGKTCVFTVIALEHVIASDSKALQVLVLAPTREVALQIEDFMRKVAIVPSSSSSLSPESSNPVAVKCAGFIGGLGGGSALKLDKDKLKSCQIAVGTPGRILHLMNENLLNTTSIRIFVLDEADKLLAPEFQDSINAIYAKLPENKQTIFLSATYPPYMASFATQYMRSPTFVRLNIVDPSLRGIQQFYKITPYSHMSNIAFDHKANELIKLLSSVEFQQAIIFTNYQIKGESLCETLSSNGWPAVFISGSIDQVKRTHAINQLKQHKCRILISTDLTSRGIDVQNVDLVVSMDVPVDPETYLHRIGRAGRYGSYGRAVSFVTKGEESTQFEAIIDSYNLNITQFNKNLEDIEFIQNAEKSRNREDDVTIERVKLTRNEFDQSLFEYEKHKAEMKNLYESKRERAKERKSAAQNLRSKEDKDKEEDEEDDDDILHVRVTHKELEEDLERYLKGDTERNYEEKWESNGLEIYELDITEEQIVEIEASIEKRWQEILQKINEMSDSDDEPTEKKSDKNTTKRELEKEKPKNLNEIFKWVDIDKNDKQSEKEKPVETTDNVVVMRVDSTPAVETTEDRAPAPTVDDLTRFNQLYSNYFTQYYKQYFNEFYNSSNN